MRGNYKGTKNMLNKLKEKFRGVYTEESLECLEHIEEYFCFEHFDSQDALDFGMLIVKESEKYDDELFVRIIRMEDDLSVFQYVGDRKNQRNIDFAMLKANTVQKTRHCSLWALVKEQVQGGVTSVFCENSNCLPVSGAFPIFVKEEMRAIVAVSGLQEGLDFQVVIDALIKYKNVEVPRFNGRLI